MPRPTVCRCAAGHSCRSCQAANSAAILAAVEQRIAEHKDAQLAVRYRIRRIACEGRKHQGSE